MSPSVDDVLSCPQKYDKAHQDFYQRYAAVLAAKHSLSNQCTEDPNISGTRVDAYVETPTEKYPQRRSSV
jgi:hypothetical protein